MNLFKKSKVASRPVTIATLTIKPWLWAYIKKVGGYYVVNRKY